MAASVLFLVEKWNEIGSQRNVILTQLAVMILVNFVLTITDDKIGNKFSFKLNKKKRDPATNLLLFHFKYDLLS